jgi:acetyl esterase/lipase
LLNALLSMRGRLVAASCLALLLTLASGCTPLMFGIANLPARISGVTRHAGLVYRSGERGLLDVYAKEGGRNRPVVVFWYGGSWQEGDRQRYRFAGAALAQAGYVAILPDYRLYPAVRFPEFNNDAAQAVVWAHAHAAEYGGDAGKLFLMGHSAGAHIAASTALDGRYLRRAGGDPAWIRGLIGLSGPYVLKPNTAALNRIFAAPYTPADWQLQNYVSAASPPALLIHGANDTLVDPSNSGELAAKLRAAGVAAQVRVIAGIGHSDTVAALSVPVRKRAPTLALVRAFIDARSAEIDAVRVR